MITKFNPYLTFNGNCEYAFNFYKTVFGGEYSTLVRYNETQNEETSPPVPEEKGNHIRHIALPLNNNTVLMGSDVFDSESLIQGNNLKISFSTDTKEEAKRIFTTLSQEGTVKVPLSGSFWGLLYGSLIDKFGIHWLIDVPNNQHKQQFEDNANIHIP